jgi:hypothetical protein
VTKAASGGRAIQRAVTRVKPEQALYEAFSVNVNFRSCAP